MDKLTAKHRRETTGALGDDAHLQEGRSQIVVAEEDPDLRRKMASALRGDGYDVIEIDAGDQLLETLGSDVLRGPRTYPDLIITDARASEPSGISVLAGLRRADWNTPVILISEASDAKTHVTARRLGAIVFDTPFDVDDLRTAVMHLIANRSREAVLGERGEHP